MKQKYKQKFAKTYSEFDLYVPIDEIDCLVDNLAYGDRTSKRKLLKDYYDSYYEVDEEVIQLKEEDTPLEDNF